MSTPAIDVEIHHPLGEVTLDVRMALEGGLTAFLGPSGSGKTRTLDVIAGLLRPARGRVAVDGHVLTDTSAGVWVPPHRRRIGYVFQEPRLFPHFTVKHNLDFGRWFSRRTESPLISMEKLVDLLDLGGLLPRHPARLSGGERRRVALGRALLSNPRLLLLDEPLGSLEAAKREEILPYLDRLIAELRLPMIYVTHDWREIEGRAAEVVLMNAGRSEQQRLDSMR